ncbi:MAG: hypothetical protein O3C40_31750 [Planctomycetota bacterium]|nr:hypothetical protein [Planctomycetota bacterium]
MPAGDYEITVAVTVKKNGEHYWDSVSKYTRAGKEQVTGVQLRMAEAGGALVKDGIHADGAKPKKQ